MCIIALYCSNMCTLIKHWNLNILQLLYVRQPQIENVFVEFFLPDFGQFYYNYNICNTKTMGLMYWKCPSKSLTKICASITLNFNKSFLYCFILTWKFLMINLMVDLIKNQVSSVKHKWRLSQNHACVNQSRLEALLIFINFGYHLHHFVFMKIDQFLKNMSIAHANPFFVCYEQKKYAILSVHRVFSR